MREHLGLALVAALCLSWAGPTAGQQAVSWPGDFDGNGTVDFSDFFMFADAFGSSDPGYDLDGNGTVDFSDFFRFADSFGSSPPANRVPALTDIGALSVAEGATLNLTLSGSDPDDDTLTYTVSGAPTGSSLSGHIFTWTPGYEAAGRYSVTFTVSDGRGGTDRQTVTVVVTDFEIPGIKRFNVAVNTAKKGIDATKHVVAGDTVVVNLTADGSLDGTHDAITYRAASILKIVGADGVTVRGTGVTDLGNGRATLTGNDWSAGKRSIILKDTSGYDSLLVTIFDSTTAGGPFTGQLDSLIVYKPAPYVKIIVSAPAAATAGREFTVGVRLTDTYSNTRVDDDRFVSISANKLGVEFPAGPVFINNGVGSFVAKANTAMTGLAFRVVDLIDHQDRAFPDHQGFSSAVTVGAATDAALDAPDTLIAEDYIGADGAGDQGGFILLTFSLSSDHATLTGYQFYREVPVNYDVADGALTELATPATAMMSWGRIDATPGATVGRAIVAALDNVASVWAIAAERDSATSGKEAFDATAVVATPYELMASTMVASQKAALQPNAPVFATLTPEALAYIEKDVAPSFQTTDVALSAQVLTAAPVRAIDNIAPEAVTYLRAMDTSADTGSSVTVVWAKSASDQMLPRFVDSAVSNGAVSDVVAGVNGYNVYRKVGTGEYALVGTAGAGETSFADLTTLNGVRYTYKVQPFDQDNETTSDLSVDFIPPPSGVTGWPMEFIWIEPGTFTMGDAERGLTPHQVILTQGYYLGKYEVTQGQWQAVMRTTPWLGQWGVHEEAIRAAVISWDNAQELVHVLNQAAGDSLYRLPTEAEWEYACRAGTTTHWSFGDDESQLGWYAWYSENSVEDSLIWRDEELVRVGIRSAHPVGTRLPNPWGLCDMHGNVSEWVQDWYGDYTPEAQTDPPGPASGSRRVTRGGNCESDNRRTWTATRLEAQSQFTGARLVRIR
ncbi:MAG: SUMF1/EgtB/PvdO family nonheme iron enzyme [Candidatus Latescibacterota bacterium]|jgi:formylglycine-generating enzyme required for sulfatase activity